MKTIAINLTGNPDPIAKIHLQLKKQDIAVDVVGDDHLVAYIELEDANNDPDL